MENQWCAVDVMGADRCLWRYVVKKTGRNVLVAPPAWEVDGRRVGGSLARVAQVGKPAMLAGGVTETVYAGHVVGAEDLLQELAFRIPADSPLVSVQYRIRASGEHTLGHGERYLGLALSGLQPQGLTEGQCVPGPRLVAEGEEHVLLAACQDKSLRYCLQPEAQLVLCAQRGDVAALSDDQGYQTPWFALGTIAGDEEALQKFAETLGW